MFEIEVKGIKETVRGLEDIRRIVNETAPKIHLLGATMFQTKAQENEHAVDTGTLRRSIHTTAPGMSHNDDFNKAYSESSSNKTPIKASKEVIKEMGMYKTFIGTWLGYGKKIHRDGGINGKGQFFLRKAFNSEYKNVQEFIRRETAKLLKLGAKWSESV